jgi:hypothetical protein
MEDIKARIIKRLEDLKLKIETNEDMPESPMDISTLVEIDDRLEEILSCWYY